MSNTGAEFKYTIPITKALSSSDGELYLEGIASGTEVDAHGDRMTPEAILDFSRQIHEALENNEPIAFTERHDEDNVFRELGEIVDGWINDRFQLGIKVRLNQDNPASGLLFKDISKGKKHGMSIKGFAPDEAVVKEFDPVLGRIVRTISKVILTSVGRTSSPSYTPSFGSVISKALSMHEATEGDNSSMGDSTPQAEEELQKSAAEDIAPEAEEPQENNEEEISKSEIQFDKGKLAKLQRVIALADELGLLSDVVETKESDVVEKSSPDEEDDRVDLVLGAISKVADVLENMGNKVVELDSRFSEQIEKTNNKLDSILRETPEGNAPNLEKAAPTTQEDVLGELRSIAGKKHMSMTDRMYFVNDRISR